MAAKKKESTDAPTGEVLGILQPIADGLKVAVGELWGIFVRQSIVKGLSALFTAFSCYAGAYFAHTYIKWWSIIPVVIGHLLTYDAINLLGNPKYYALNDITEKMNELKDER